MRKIVVGMFSIAAVAAGLFFVYTPKAECVACPGKSECMFEQDCPSYCFCKKENKDDLEGICKRRIPEKQ